ncbi:MAG: exo-alpha-sialidase [Opitutae bacterium]|nr:exo-alpha-sialidase [Opitutae bacterium]
MHAAPLRRGALLLAAAFLLGLVRLPAATVEPVVAPAGADAMCAALATAPDGTVFLSWLEPAGPDATALKFARYDAAQNRWGDARLIAHGRDWFVNWADFPVLAVQTGGRMTAVWFAYSPAHAAPGQLGRAYHAEVSTSDDGGATWTSPRPLATGSDSVEFVALQPLADGRMLALWLDSRHRATNGDRQSLYAKFIGSDGSDLLLDDAVCDCCQITTALTPGGMIAAYRGRTADEVRDIRLVEFRDGRWTKPHPLHLDRWNITGCPVNGPQLSSRGAQVAATWFTAARSQPRVFTKLSTDGGATFGAPLRIDLGRPQGRVDNVLVADGTTVVTWLETGAGDGQAGGIYLRTISPAGVLSEPQMLAPATESRAGGFPRMTVLGANRLLLAYTLEAEPSRVVTLLVSLND